MKTTLNYLKILLPVTCLLATLNGFAQSKEPEVFKARIISADKPAAPLQKNTQPVAASSNAASNLNKFYGIYYYWVPGTSFIVPDYSRQQNVIHNSAGTGVLPGSIKINADGTYIWNSSWDQKIIKGKWRLTGDKDYPIEMINAQEKKNWKVGLHDRPKEADLYIKDGNTWYSAKKVK
ncbi:hypothetical protein [Pedobacter montanisoli]|uniref:Uncharacterized protein n=1 Tax=Pedobacter montanisoli TaxID=2923277 RepID=A0ABS9ZXM2_9SPHI|nr:hypothetical protein [Pedobacter montanisoli]MCJ0743076.1 hypothetical protein [Pedobacter montanisoli]